MLSEPRAEFLAEGDVVGQHVEVHGAMIRADLTRLSPRDRFGVD
jgi:hypothetical protein